MYLRQPPLQLPLPLFSLTSFAFASPDPPSPLSLLACRVIQHELSPRFLWTVKILLDPNQVPPPLFHDRDNHLDHIYPGSIASIKPSSNILLLEVDSGSSSNDNSRFSRLAFGDQTRLLDPIDGKVRQQRPCT